MLILVRVTGQYGWMMWLAKDMKVTYRSVDQLDGEYTTVVIMRMQGYNAVSLLIVKFDVIDAWLNSVKVRYNLINLNLIFLSLSEQEK